MRIGRCVASESMAATCGVPKAADKTTEIYRVRTDGQSGPDIARGRTPRRRLIREGLGNGHCSPAVQWFPLVRRPPVGRTANWRAPWKTPRSHVKFVSDRWIPREMSWELVNSRPFGKSRTSRLTRTCWDTERWNGSSTSKGCSSICWLEVTASQQQCVTSSIDANRSKFLRRSRLRHHCINLQVWHQLLYCGLGCGCSHWCCMAARWAGLYRAICPVRHDAASYSVFIGLLACTLLYDLLLGLGFTKIKVNENKTICDF